MASRTEMVRLDLIEKDKYDKLMSLVDLDSDVLTIDISEPSDGQTLVYNAEAQKWVNGSASGSDGVFLVTFDEMLGEYTADKTLEEISEASSDGNFILCRIGNSFGFGVYSEGSLGIPASLSCEVNTLSSDSLWNYHILYTEEDTSVTLNVYNLTSLKTSQ